MLPSLRMGRYVAEGLLGPGGVTETFLAHLSDEAGEAAGQLFALKLLRRDRIPERVYARVAQGFVAAGHRLRSFARPGFGKVVDVSGDAEATFIVTEYVVGRDLARLLEMSRAEGQGRPGLDPLLAGLLGAEIARLLQVAHTAKPSLAHLGLCPQNVLVTDEGEVLLVDAGIAAAIRSLTEQPAERWWFVAPELAGAVALDEREAVAADLYSLGALLHFLITGAPPGQTGEPASPADLPGVSPRVNAALRSLLERRPEGRPDSAAALVDRLSSGADGVRQRQRLIAEGLRQAEKDAREAAARARDPGSPPDIKVPRPADSMVEDALARALPALGKPHQRRRVLASVLFAALGGALALLSLALSAGLRFGSGPRAERESPAGEGQTTVTEPWQEPGRAEGDPQAPTREQVRSHLAGHLVVETVPPGATVWVDGVMKGTTFADIFVGPGSHRVVLTLPGHRMFRDVVDTGRGAIIRRNLVKVPPPAQGSGFVRIECQTVGKFPILIDDEETGFVCPSLKVPTAAGKHAVGIFIPATRKVISVDITVEPGAKPAVAKFAE